MRIKVKKKHIKKGIRDSSTNCPVALAIKEKFGTAVVVIVQRGRAVVVTRDKHKGLVSLTTELPISIVSYINSFDTGLKIQPVQFKAKFKAS